ncbi:MAG: hypothetical protein IT326_08745 [Anaerolineae bacterium]|nr:hypothetical protein [Anaerolineae bacterium]
MTSQAHESAVVLPAARRMAPALAYLVALYLATAIMAGRDPRPPGLLAQAVFELRHIVIHFAGYLIQAWLLAWGLPAGHHGRRVAALVLLLALGIGLGQEALQALLRGYVRLWPSAFDLLVDGAGAALGLVVFWRWRGWQVRPGAITPSDT